jgi:putative sterol carrier protein
MEMGFLYPSLEWAKELQRICNTDPEFKEAVQDFSGKMMFHVEADEKLAKDVCLFLDIGDGQVKEAAEYANMSDRPDTDYIMSAKYTQWKEVISGNLEPLRAIMTRMMKLVKGSQLKILKYVKFTLKMMANSKAVDSTFGLEK